MGVVQRLETATHRLRRWLNGAVSAAIPQTCCACERWTHPSDGPLCAPCAARVRALQSKSYCPRCGRTASPLIIDEDGCGLCRGEARWNFRALVRVAPYESPVEELVKGLKYRGVERHGDLLARWLSDVIASAPWRAEVDALTPVPMHRERRRNRPCEHAYVLARKVGARLGIPVRRAVVRVRNAPSQLSVATNAARLANVQRCFEPAGRANAGMLTRIATSLGATDPRSVEGLTICIIDNVMVSGATVCEVAKALRRGGAKRIYAAVVARSTVSGDESPREQA